MASKILMRVPLPLRRGTTAYGPEGGIGDVPPDERKDLVDKVDDAVLVRHPVHRAGEDHGGRLFGIGGRLEVLGIHARRDYGDAAGLDVLEKRRAIVFGDG